MSPCFDIFVYFRYQNGNARLFDFWYRPFYQMEIKPKLLHCIVILLKIWNGLDKTWDVLSLDSTARRE